MKLDIIWNKEEYNKFIEYLFSVNDLKYKIFSENIIKDTNIIGIRLPDLKKMAKEISRGDYLSFIKYNKHKYHEETILHGLIIGYIKNDFKITLKLLNGFLKYNNNWATNDSTITNLKIFKYNLEEGYNYILHLLETKKEYYVRFGLILLLCYYINDTYIDRIINICESIDNDEYYVKMANAWLIATCYIKYKDKFIKLFIDNKLDKGTTSKAIQKICDSYRISKEDKEFLKSLKE